MTRKARLDRVRSQVSYFSRRRDVPYDEDIFGVPLEPITDEIIHKLVKRGWSRQHIVELRAAGWRYCPKRGTIVLREW